MTNQQHVEAGLRKLEKDFGSDAVYDFFSGFHDAAVHGHTSDQADNPHDATEQPAHTLYHLGAKAAESLKAQLRKS